jgi:hypothetical protein
MKSGMYSVLSCAECNWNYIIFQHPWIQNQCGIELAWKSRCWWPNLQSTVKTNDRSIKRKFAGRRNGWRLSTLSRSQICLFCFNIIGAQVELEDSQQTSIFSKKRDVDDVLKIHGWHIIKAWLSSIRMEYLDKATHNRSKPTLTHDTSATCGSSPQLRRFQLYEDSNW